MTKKTVKLLGAAMSIAALSTLALPIAHTVIGYVESMDLTLRDINLIEFSFWGVLVILAPLLSIGTMYSKLCDKEKMIAIMSIFTIGMISLSCAIRAANTWLYDVATGYVQPISNQILYVVFFFAASLLFYFSCRMKTLPDAEELLEGFRHYADDSNIEITPRELISEDFFLCNRPHEFIKFKKGTDVESIQGCVSFLTEDGYFSALGHEEDVRYIESGAIEIFDGDDNLGFAFKTTPAGLLGAFYNSEKYKGDKMKLRLFEDIEPGDAELWLPTYDGDFEKIPVELKLISPDCIECKRGKSRKAFPKVHIDGSAIIQDGKIAAVISGYDASRDVYTCISAEDTARELFSMAHKKRLLQSIRSFIDKVR